MTFAWDTSRRSNSSVEYCLPSACTGTVTSPAYVTHHTLTATDNVVPGTAYTYYIHSTSTDGQVVSSGANYCTTQVGGCTQTGGYCISSDSCCSGYCCDNTCSAVPCCSANNNNCNEDEDCCSEHCCNGVCKDYCDCGPTGSICSFDKQCCSGYCANNTCKTNLGSSDYVPPEVSISGAIGVWGKEPLSAKIVCTDESGCDASTYRFKSYTNNPLSCPNVYSLYNISASSPEEVYNHQWLCGAAMDNNENVGFTEHPTEFRIDSEAPITSIISPGEGSIQTKDFQLSLGDEDTGGSELQLCYYQIQAKNGDQWLTTKGWTARTCSIPITVSLSGGDCPYSGDRPACKIRAYATDMAGNIGNIAERNFIISPDHPDENPPTRGSYNPMENTLQRSEFDLSFNLNEKGNCKWGLENADYDNLAKSCDGDGTTIICHVSNLPHGLVTIYVGCEDALGNKDTKSTTSSLKYLIQDDVMKIDIVSPENNSKIAAGWAKVLFKTEDTNTQKFQYSYDGIVWSDMDIPFQAQEDVYSYNFTSLHTGKNTLYIRGYGIGGVGTPSKVVVDVTVDVNLAPQVTIDYPGYYEFYFAVDEVEFTATDEEATNMDCKYRVDNLEWIDTTAENGVKKTVPITIPEGWHDVSVKCSDGSKWTNPPVIHTFYVHSSNSENITNMPPEVIIKYPKYNGNYESIDKITFLATDDKADEVDCNAEIDSNGMSSKKVHTGIEESIDVSAVGDGWHTATVSCFDGKNWTLNPPVVFFYIQTNKSSKGNSPPAVSIEYPTNGGTYNNINSFLFKTVDDSSSDLSCMYSIDSLDWKSVGAVNNTKTKVDIVVGRGGHMLTVRCYDGSSWTPNPPTYYFFVERGELPKGAFLTGGSFILTPKEESPHEVVLDIRLSPDASVPAYLVSINFSNPPKGVLLQDTYLKKAAVFLSPGDSSKLSWKVMAPATYNVNPSDFEVQWDDEVKLELDSIPRRTTNIELNISGKTDPDVCEKYNITSIKGENDKCRTKIVVNKEEPIYADVDGRFSKTVFLEPGENLVTVTAVDPGGNRVFENFKVEYTPPLSALIIKNLFPIIALLVLAIVLTVVVVFHNINRSKTEIKKELEKKEIEKAKERLKMLKERRKYITKRLSKLATKESAIGLSADEEAQKKAYKEELVGIQEELLSNEDFLEELAKKTNEVVELARRGVPSKEIRQKLISEGYTKKEIGIIRKLFDEKKKSIKKNKNEK
ncbi:MAG: hypothetical protein J7L23_01655 [Candidatus Diapherotrites archaeon]|nr:hypothetical protein [Candidatus Diapherotrites archaeon]